MKIDQSEMALTNGRQSGGYHPLILVTLQVYRYELK
jgi:hypothetical protein